ncbi:MAG: penicillin-binding protein 1C [Elusimicrobiota bacterium]
MGFWACLPHPLFNDPYSPILLDREGTLLGAKVASDGQWRFPPLKEVPPAFRSAVVHYEDKRFFRHVGVDPLALARAFRQNRRRGRVVSGGSTLTMQTVRLARKSRRRSYREKFMEALGALALEATRSKEDILRLYAAHAPFGGNVVGLEAAAWRYFGRPPDRLSWAESCLLAVLPNTPSLIHPGKNREALRRRRDSLLESLHRAGKLGDLELRLALLEPLPGEPRPFPREAPHLLETLLAGRPQKIPRYETTLDAELQRTVQALVSRRSAELSTQNIHNAAALVVDNEDMSIRAYVGNSRLKDYSQFGYAVDIVQRPRSTGSILKPFLYAAMLQAGEILPTTLVPDTPIQYEGYIPQNNDRRYRGAVPAREALARSLNIPAVRLLREHGVARFYNLLKNLGMTTLFRSPEEYGLTLILGGAEGTLWDMTGLYARMMRTAEGRIQRDDGRCPALHVLRGDRSNEVLGQDLGPGAAWLTLQALLEVARPEEESHWRNFSSGQKIAWKTGTSLGYRDGWALGTKVRYTVGVWTGNASGEGRPDLTGTVSAAPILFEIFNRVDSSPWPRAPEPDLKEVEVCRDDGYLPVGNCPTEIQRAPLDSHFETPSPYHPEVHLDMSKRWRVHGGCESVARMTHVTWFALPPAQEYYYRRHHPEYRSLPPFREDCRGLEAGENNPIALIYPHPNTRLYIPVDLDEEKERTVFQAVHRDEGAVLHWHLDGQYIGRTRVFHQIALDIAPGPHEITLVDHFGNHLRRRFKVLGGSKPGL